MIERDQEERKPTVSIQDWVVWPVADYVEYLDRPPVEYEDPDDDPDPPPDGPLPDELELDLSEENE